MLCPTCTTIAHLRSFIEIFQATIFFWIQNMRLMCPTLAQLGYYCLTHLIGAPLQEPLGTQLQVSQTFQHLLPNLWFIS